MNIETRIRFLTSQLAALAPALESKHPHVRFLSHTALHELRVWEALHPCDDPAVRAKAAELAAGDAARKQQQATTRNASLDEWKRSEAPKLWREWHRRALTHLGDDSAYLAGLLKAIPCGTCKQNFARHVAANPPQWNHPDWSYFDWTVAVHNAANRELGKSVLTILEARELY